MMVDTKWMSAWWWRRRRRRRAKCVQGNRTRVRLTDYGSLCTKWVCVCVCARVSAPKCNNNWRACFQLLKHHPIRCQSGDEKKCALTGNWLTDWLSVCPNALWAQGKTFSAVAAAPTRWKVSSAICGWEARGEKRERRLSETMQNMIRWGRNTADCCTYKAFLNNII